jgi:hypothetical protein
MKKILVIICCLFVMQAIAQDNFGKHIRRIVADSSDMYRNMRSTFKSLSEGGDSAWHTKFQFEGTKESEVEIDDSAAVFSVFVADSVKRKKGENICDELRDKIAITLPTFDQTKYKVVDYSPSSYGWTFRKGHTHITIRMMGKDNINMVWLTIYYYSPLPYKKE